MKNMPALSGRLASSLSRLWVAVLSATLVLAACGKTEPPPPPTPAPVPVSVMAVAPTSVPIQFEVVGQTEGSKQVEVRARVGGILLKRLYTEGEPVKAGQPLFQIDRASYEIALEQARAALNQEKARFAQSQREAERLKPLVAERAISRKEFDDATSALQLSQASQQQFAARVREAELNLSYTVVTAPVAGISGRAPHSDGSLISTDAAGSLLTTINQVSPIYVRFSLAQSDLAKLPNGGLARDSSPDVQILLGDGSRYPVKGRLNFAATEIDPRLGTQQLRAEFDNPKARLVPGDFVKVQVVAGKRDNVFLVPQAAVLQTEKGYFVFVVDADSKAAMRQVQLGDWVGSDWTVLSGLKAGDRVIVDNLLKVRPGSSVTPRPAGGAAAPPGAAASTDAGAGGKDKPAAAPASAVVAPARATAAPGK